MNNNGPLVELISYTDPYCTWCWGSEPMLRRIQEVYGEQVAIKFVMGGLVADIAQFYDAANDIGGENWSDQVAAHWVEASNRHGMPVDARVFSDIKDDWTSTYPANIAYKAAQLQDEKLANLYLRRMREAAAAERRPIHHAEVQAELAREVGLDPERLLQDIDGPAKSAFAADLEECRSRGVRGFPTFLARNNEGTERLLRGYQSFGVFASVFEFLSGGAIVPRPFVAGDSKITAFVAKYGKVAPREIAEVFSLSADETTATMERLVSEGLLASQPVGNGTFYRPGSGLVRPITKKA